jgi:hypothetical protein
MAFDRMILSFFGLQRRKFTRIMDSSVQAVSVVIASNHGLSVPKSSLTQGQQCLNFDSRVDFSSLESNSMLMPTPNARILVAIYQFGCRMSNTKVSP